MIISRAGRLVMATTACIVLSGAATAQDARNLVIADPANRSASIESIRAIIGLVAERSQSEAVRTRARTTAVEGRLTVGVDEVLAEIGAVAALGMPPTLVAAPTAAIASQPTPPPLPVEVPVPVPVAVAEPPSTAAPVAPTVALAPPVTPFAAEPIAPTPSPGRVDDAIATPVARPEPPAPAVPIERPERTTARPQVAIATPRREPVAAPPPSSEIAREPLQPETKASVIRASKRRGPFLLFDPTDDLDEDAD